MKLKLFFLLMFTIFCVSSSQSINWQPGNWAMNCDFEGNDLSNVQTKGELCSSKCQSTFGCTHYSWSDYNGGTCWLKKGPISKDKAIFKLNTVCGIVETGQPPQGVPIKRGQLIWSDEFNYLGAPNSNDWNQELGGHGWGNNELQYYSDKNAQVYNGLLTIESKKENLNNMRYTSTRLVSKKKFKYGIIEYRAKLPKGRGTWPAFWLLASKRPLNWPGDGEIDIMEHVGYDPNIVHATIHTTKYNHMIGTQKFNKVKINNVFDEFHTYSLDWNANRLRFYIDDVEIFTYTKENNANQDSWPFDNEMNIIINTAIGGNWGGVQGVDDSVFPAVHVVDYVRHYASLTN
jgi:beta-glucanase (GH16 family)